VNIREVDGERVVVFEVRLNPTDVGKVIGKSGRTNHRDPYVVDERGGETWANAPCWKSSNQRVAGASAGGDDAPGGVDGVRTS